MFQENTLRAGLIQGVIFPAVGFGILFLFFKYLETSGWASQEGFAPNFRVRTIMLIAICLNIIPMNLAFQSKRTEAMRGVVLATFIFGVIWVVLFREQFFGAS